MPIQTPNFERYISIQEFARIAHVTEATVLNLLTSGKLPGIRIGRQWRIPVTRLEAMGIKIERVNGSDIANTDTHPLTGIPGSPEGGQ